MENREIKFRAYSSASSIMIYDSFLIQQKTGKCFYTDPEIYGYEQKVKVYDCGEEEPILMQFIGLKDNNGKEIYEGDILKTHGERDNYPSNQVIVFNQSKSAFRMSWVGHYMDKKYTGFYDKRISANGFKIFEIIGNIHENPELLK